MKSSDTIEILKTQMLAAQIDNQIAEIAPALVRLFNELELDKVTSLKLCATLIGNLIACDISPQQQTAFRDAIVSYIDRIIEQHPRNQKP